MICFYQCTYGERIGQSLESIGRIAPYVDRAIILVDETVTDEQKRQLRDLGCEIYPYEWRDSTVAMRNEALQKIQTDDYVITADPDEFLCKEFCENVREICRRAEEKGFDLLLINSHDIQMNFKRRCPRCGYVDETQAKRCPECNTLMEIIRDQFVKSERKSTFYKNLIFRKRDGTHYEGIGASPEEKEFGWHETLIIPGTVKAVRLPDKFYYEHRKWEYEDWERSMRNVYVVGGGNDSRDRNPSWRPLREICDSLGIKNWPQLRAYLRKGNIDPRLKEWFWRNRTEGFDYDHEEMHGGLYYFWWLHPEQKTFPDGRGWEPVFEVPKGSPAEVMSYVEQLFLEILGRHADQEGKEAYTRAILEGRIRREDLPTILKQSREYMEKVKPMEGVRLQVPVNVDVRVSEDLFVQALIRSKTFWDKIKPRLDIGEYLEEELGEEWVNFQKWFYSERPTMKQFAKKLEEVVEGA